MDSDAVLDLEAAAGRARVASDFDAETISVGVDSLDRTNKAHASAAPSRFAETAIPGQLDAIAEDGEGAETKSVELFM
jgi:hypothetical protein